MNRLECTEALTSLQKELALYQHRDSNVVWADGQAADQAASRASRLAKATADVAHYTGEVARPGQTLVELTRNRKALISATAQRDVLTLDSAAQGGSVAYLTDVDADQLTAQVAVLTAAVQQVQARLAALPA